MAHELAHQDSLFDDFPDIDGDGVPDYDVALDRDGDLLSDAYDDNNGLNKDLPSSNPFGPSGMDDFEFIGYSAEASWPNDSHNDDDWATPGKNHSGL